MKTVTIQIGNSDDKLSQIEWAQFINSVYEIIAHRAKQIHFSGHSNPAEIWQNAAWIFEIGEDEGLRLWGEMKVLASAFKQDSIAWTEGITVFAEAMGKK